MAAAGSKNKERDWLALDRVRQPDGRFLSYRELMEERYPSRAVAVSKYIDLGMDSAPQIYQAHGQAPRRSGPAQQRREHPAKMAAKARQKMAKAIPLTQEDRDLQWLKYNLDRTIREHPDRAVAEGLRVFAAFLAPKVQIEQDLPGPVHRQAIEDFLTGSWGMTADYFPKDLYLAWRERSRRRLRAS